MTITFNRKKFSQAIIDKRLKENIYLVDVAKKTGLGKSTIHQCENGKVFYIDVILKLCAWLGKKPDYFIDIKKPVNADKKKR